MNKSDIMKKLGAYNWLQIMQAYQGLTRDQIYDDLISVWPTAPSNCAKMAKWIDVYVNDARVGITHA